MAIEAKITELRIYNHSRNNQILFLVKSGRKERMHQTESYPTDFFYGFHELSALGLNIALVEDAEVGMSSSSAIILKGLTKLSAIFGGLPVGMFAGLVAGGHCKRLSQAACLVATTNGIGMALAMAKAIGLLNRPVVLLAMGLLPMRAGKWRKYLYGRLVRHLKVVSISKGEAQYLGEIFSTEEITYLPFGVDASFWKPRDFPKFKEGEYVLAIGNDYARDWLTLVNSWKPDLPMLKIVTSLPVPMAVHAKNIEVIRGDWRTRVLSDSQILNLYQEALFVVVPLRETIQPAGQSVCLQAMACGKPVILSKVAGLWDPEIIKDGENVLLVPSADEDALGSAVSRLVSDPELRERIGGRAREIVEHNFNTGVMAESLCHFLEKVVKT